MLRVASATDTSKKDKTKNEDAVFAQVLDVLVVDGQRRSAAVLCVCDGLGGYRGGAEASRAAVACAVRTLEAHPIEIPGKEATTAAIVTGLETSLNEHFRPRLREEILALGGAAANPSAKLQEVGFATTFTLAVACEEAVCYSWMGDSRVYRIRNGRLFRLSEDDSEGWTGDDLQAYFESKKMTRQISPIMSAEWTFPVKALDSKPGDVVLCCSDGVFDWVYPWQLEQVAVTPLVADLDPDEYLHYVMGALSPAIQDDATIALAFYGHPGAAPGAPKLTPALYKLVRGGYRWSTTGLAQPLVDRWEKLWSGSQSPEELASAWAAYQKLTPILEHGEGAGCPRTRIRDPEKAITFANHIETLPEKPRIVVSPARGPLTADQIREGEARFGEDLVVRRKAGEIYASSKQPVWVALRGAKQAPIHIPLGNKVLLGRHYFDFRALDGGGRLWRAVRRSRHACSCQIVPVEGGVEQSVRLIDGVEHVLWPRRCAAKPEGPAIFVDDDYVSPGEVSMVFRADKSSVEVHDCGAENGVWLLQDWSDASPGMLEAESALLRVGECLYLIEGELRP